MLVRITQSRKLLLILSAVFIGLLARPLPAQAQAEWSRWYFGNMAGLRFTPDSAVVLSDSRMVSGAASAVACDSVGKLRLYSNGQRVWNGRHQLLVNGTTLGGDSVSSQGCALVPNPLLRNRYYLFTLDAWSGTRARRGLRMAELDVRAANGQGQVLRVNQPVVPDSLLRRLGNHDFMEVQAIVRHPNGHDFWLVTHLLDTNQFLSVLVTGQGFTRSSVVLSAAGIVRTLLPGNANSLADTPGMLAVAPNGRRLALVSLISGAEVFNFDPNTGQVTNPIFLGWGVYSAGAAFSPNSNLLYTSRQGPAIGVACTLNAITEVRQFDVSLPTAAAVAASSLVVYAGCGSQVWGMQRAINGRIYVANLYNSATNLPTNTLDVIQLPNVRGVGCQYTTAGIGLGAGRWVARQFPVVPNEPPQPRLQALQLAAGACVGQAIPLNLTGTTLGAVGDTLDWSFGDGTTLRTQQPQATHAYATAGTYQLVVRLRNRPLGSPEQLTTTITVAARPSLNLGPDLRLCAGTTMQLSVGSLPTGTTVRWYDGSTSPTHIVSASGIYWAELTAGGGCTARDSVAVSSLPAPTLALAANQPLCPAGSVVLSPGPQPVGSRYQWQDGSTAASLVVATPGTYSVTVTSPDGCASQASLVVPVGSDCPYLIPSIITPNADTHNDFFVLQGLSAADWQLTIYNRWGRQVFQQASYDNQWDAAGQSAGFYYYLLQHSRTGQQHKGWLEVVK